MNSQRYWCIFGHTHRYVTRLEGEASPAGFWKSKKVPWFWRKSHHCIHLWVRRKNSKMFPCGTFFSCVFGEIFIKCPSSTNPSLPWNISGCAPAFLIVLFAKLPILNVWQCSEYSTVTLSYVLHQTHSESWHIQSSVYSCIFRHIQTYSSLSSIFRHIEALLRNIQVYSGTLRTLSNPCIFTTLP